MLLPNDSLKDLSFSTDVRLLGCPGPTNVATETKRAQLGPDICHKEREFCALVKRINETALALLDGGSDYTAVTLTCSGTGANEAMLSQVHGRLLVLNNGRYAQRLYDMAVTMGLNVAVYSGNACEPLDCSEVESFLQAYRNEGALDFDYIACVHHETERGILNPVEPIGHLCRKYGAELLIDSISGIGAHSFSLRQVGPAFCTVSSNKCLESVPGASLVFCQKSALNIKGRESRSPYFDINRHHEKQQNGDMLFTPATHVLLALEKALERFADETYQGRVERYRHLNKRFRDSLKDIGLTAVNPSDGSNIVTLIKLPDKVNYLELCQAARAKGLILFTAPALIEEGILSVATMGALVERDVDNIIQILQHCLTRQIGGTTASADHARPVDNVSGLNTRPPMHRRIEVSRVGIVGAGPRAEKLIGGLHSLGIGIGAVCDIDAPRARVLADKSDASSAYGDIKDFLKAGCFEAVLVCTDAANHAWPTIKVAEAGLPVLCEKPLGQSLAECDAMIAAGHRNRVAIGCHLQSRHFNRTNWLRDHIAKGSFGKTVSVRACGATIHIWDSLLYLLGQVDHVYASWSIKGNTEPDIRKDPLLATLMFAAGHTAVVEAFPVYLEKRPNWANSVCIHGDDIQITYDLWANEMNISGGDPKQIEQFQEDFRRKYTSTGTSPGFVDQNHPVLIDFASALEEARAPLVSAADARASIELVSAAYKSAHLLKPVTLPLTKMDPFYHTPGCVISD